MTTIDYIVIIVFSLGVFVAGMSFSRSGKNLKTFFAGGGEVPWWISGLSLFMSFFSAGTFVAWGSLAYMHGAVSISVQWTMCLAGFIIAGFVAARWRRTGVLTGAEFIGARLGEGVKKAYSYLFLAISVFTSGAFLYPVAKIVEGATGFPFEYVVVGIATAIIIYTAVGGLWAVIVTDVLQFVILSAAVLIIVPLAFDKIGGVGEFFEAAPEGFFGLTTEEYSPLFMLGFGLYNLCFIAGNWAYVQRYTSVRTPKDSRKVALLFGCLYSFSPVIWMMPPMLYRIYNPSLDIANGEANHAYMLMAGEVLPQGMVGLIVGAMMFATASSVNTTLNIVSGVFTNDLYRTMKPEAPTKELIFVARVTTVFFGIVGMLVALSVDAMGGILDVIWTVGGITGGAMYIPPLWALFSKRHTGKTVLAVSVACLLVNCLFKFNGYVTLTQAQVQILGSGLPLVLMAVLELALARKGDSSVSFSEYERKRLERMKDLDAAQLQEDRAEANLENRHGVRVIALGILATGVLIAALGVAGETGRSLVTGVGLVLVVLGGWTVSATRKAPKG
ncbi:sodium:solute symporter family protein [Pelagicoccus sp. SDUM812003]|uniref:sodium:solute symporter family protein n=1 Tax=Pelagicoccus sp. SDUM812003 TaxID=3041267 RepID=UPI00280DFDF7|nr:sodium:solute symporter family protein [Pelagicoccus sp. SDUM812003]MDQ8201427.1 Na+:solute symporter [Pelagicoccus sp. SDUM812003]